MSDDFGDTDLALEGSFSEHGSQEIAPEEEVAPTDAAGNIIGRVAVDKKKGLRFPDNKRLSADDQCCEYAVELVGKVYAIYESAGENDKCYIGSGFKISPTVVVSCQHVCRSPRPSDDGGNFTLKEVYVTFLSDTQDVSFQGLPTAEDCYRLTVIPNPPFVQLDYGYMPLNGGKKTWKTPDDFIFLRLDHQHPAAHEFIQRPFVYPSTSLPAANTPCFVAGYPSDITREKADRFTKASYASLSHTFSRFMKKTFSFGEVVKVEGEFIHHSAPTLGGCSGGLFQPGITGAENQVGFSGIHIGGSLKLGHNLVIPTTNQNFGAAYFHALVATAEYQQMNQAHLKSYYDFHANTLLPGVKNQLETHFYPEGRSKKQKTQ